MPLKYVTSTGPTSSVPNPAMPCSSTIGYGAPSLGAGAGAEPSGSEPAAPLAGDGSLGVEGADEATSSPLAGGAGAGTPPSLPHAASASTPSHPRT